MSRTFRHAIFLVLFVAVGIAQVAVFANGSSAPAGPSAGSSSMPSMSPEERAVEAYRNGDNHRVKGRKLEDEAAAKKGSDADKATAKARSEFEKSLKDFTNAAKLNPKLFQAYNGMGYAYRKTGDYAKALEMYDQAIKMAPGFFPKLSSTGPRPISRSIVWTMRGRRTGSLCRGSEAGRHPDGGDEELGGRASRGRGRRLAGGRRGIRKMDRRTRGTGQADAVDGRVQPPQRMVVGARPIPRGSCSTRRSLRFRVPGSTFRVRVRELGT